MMMIFCIWKNRKVFYIKREKKTHLRTHTQTIHVHKLRCGWCHTAPILSSAYLQYARYIPHFIMSYIFCLVCRCSALSKTTTTHFTAFISFGILSVGAISHSIVAVLLFSLLHIQMKICKREINTFATNMHSHLYYKRHIYKGIGHWTKTAVTTTNRKQRLLSTRKGNYLLSMFWRLLIKTKY